MSRGPGQLQRTICEHFALHPAQTTYETLRWELFPQRRIPKTLPGTTASDGTYRLPAAWNTSFKRALDGLADRGQRRLIVERRHLGSFEELVQHYPGKSLGASTRQLRLRLLPVLAAIVGSGKYNPHFTPVENENFYFQSLSEQQLSRVRAMWKDVEPELITRLASLAAEQLTDLFLLIARAKSLLELKPGVLQCGRSIAECVNMLINHPLMSPAVQLKLDEFANAGIRKSESAFLRVKSYIWSLTDIPRRRGSAITLKDQTIDLMDDTCPDIMRTFPGYRPQREKRGSVWTQYFGPRSSYGKEIHMLIDKTVFERFVFIRMA